MNEWIRSQNARWRELAGSTVTGWVGLDSNTGPDEAPIFLDRGSPFRQLGVLRIEREGGRAYELTTYQNDEAFGLGLRESEGRPLQLSDGYRESDLSDLPTGRVQALEAHLDAREGTDRDLIEVELTIDGRSVLIVAAEVFPDRAGPLYGWGEEDYFVFTDPAAADAVMWKTPREYTVLRILEGPEGGDVFS